MARQRMPIIRCQLAAILQERRISQRELARRTNIDRATSWAGPGPSPSSPKSVYISGKDIGRTMSAIGSSARNGS